MRTKAENSFLYINTYVSPVKTYHLLVVYMRVAWQRFWVLWRKATLQTEAPASSVFLDVWAVLGCHTTHSNVLNPICSVEKWAHLAGNEKSLNTTQFSHSHNLMPHTCWHHFSQHFALETPRSLWCSFTIQKHINCLASHSVFVCKQIISLH